MLRRVSRVVRGPFAVGTDRHCRVRPEMISLRPDSVHSAARPFYDFLPAYGLDVHLLYRECWTHPGRVPPPLRRISGHQRKYAAHGFFPLAVDRVNQRFPLYMHGALHGFHVRGCRFEEAGRCDGLRSSSQPHSIMDGSWISVVSHVHTQHTSAPLLVPLADPPPFTGYIPGCIPQGLP